MSAGSCRSAEHLCGRRFTGSALEIAHAQETVRACIIRLEWRRFSLPMETGLPKADLKKQALTHMPGPRHTLVPRSDRGPASDCLHALISC